MLLDDLADYLSSQGHGTVGTDIFLSAMPGDTASGTLVVLYETGGVFPIRAMASSPGQARMERPRVQIVVRGDDYPVARAKANDIWRSLDGLPQRTINATTYFTVSAVQSPFQLGPDLNNRTKIACNYDVLKAVSTSSST
jgi:hypothetical protein